MKYLAVFLFIILNTNLSGQIIYNDHQRPFLNIESWQWINSDNKEKEIAGKHLILEFWASWCGSCLAAIPHMNELNTKFSEDIAFVSVNSYDNRAMTKKVAQRHQMNSYIIIDQDKYLKDLFKIQLIPVTILIDKNGVLRWKGTANQLSAKLITEFIRNDTIHSVLDTTLVDQTFMLIDPKQHKQLPIQLKATRLIREQFQVSTTSLNIDFDDFPIIDMKNWVIPIIFERLLRNEAGEDVITSFKGNVPEDFSVDFLATADQKVEKTLFLSETIKAFATALNASIDTSVVRQNIQILRVNSDHLKPFLSADQEKDISAVDEDDQYIFQNLTLKELAKFIGQITNKKILFEEEEPQKYNFSIEKIVDFSEMKHFLKTVYNIEFQEKEVERNLYEFTFH